MGHEEEPLALEKLFMGIHPVTGAVVVKFEDADGGWFAISIDRNRMRGFVGQLVKFTASLQVDEALAKAHAEAGSEMPAHRLPATETALLPTSSVELARWETGGVVLRATTALGVTTQLAMTPAVAESLRQALNAPIPDGKP